jgi:hypothetical protein
MKRILLLLCFFTIGKITNGQILGGGGAALTITDNQGHNVFVSACSNMQCNAHNFTSSISSYTYPALSAPYTFLDVSWTTSTGTVYPFLVTLSDVDASPSGVKTYASGVAHLTVTKLGLLNYSFIVETPVGGI